MQSCESWQNYVGEHYLKGLQGKAQEQATDGREPGKSPGKGVDQEVEEQDTCKTPVSDAL